MRFALDAHPPHRARRMSVWIRLHRLVAMLMGVN